MIIRIKRIISQNLVASSNYFLSFEIDNFPLLLSTKVWKGMGLEIFMHELVDNYYSSIENV